VLREQLGDRRLRFNDDQRRRLAAEPKGWDENCWPRSPRSSRPRRCWLGIGKLIAQKYDGSRQRGPGRPRTAGEIEALVVRLAEENRTGAIAGSRAPCPIWDTRWPAAPSLDILERHGLEPAPERSRKTTWKEFLARHWELIVAADFFTVEVWTRKRTAALCGSVLSRFVDAPSRDRGDRLHRQRPVDEPDRPEGHRRRGRNPPRQALPDPRSRPAVHGRISEPAGRGGGRVREATAALPESECPCRTICAQYQGILPGPPDPVRRESLRTAVSQFVTHYHRNARTKA
jgi:hypothetical protein